MKKYKILISENNTFEGKFHILLLHIKFGGKHIYYEFEEIDTFISQSFSKYIFSSFSHPGNP